ncbi:MAG: pseudaminic acid cytidylyltransferase [Eubacteriales bacterium]
MKAIAIITARGGSKRIPRKNIKNFLGKPILLYSIEAALATELFQEVMVSTDDEEIARIARAAGASVPFYRSTKTSNDYATTAEVVGEVLEEYEKLGMQFDYACCIYPTAPFLTKAKLEEAMKVLIDTKCHTVMPVVAYSFPPQRSVVVRDGYLVPTNQEDMKKRSQDLEPYYHDCGQFYWLHVPAFLEQKQMIMEHTCPVFVSELEVQDIDSDVDWKLAELKYEIMIR